MSEAFALKLAIKALILPPGLFISLFLIAWILHWRYKRLAKISLYSAAIGLYLFSTPAFVDQLMGQIETIPPIQLDSPEARKAQAIVILGGGQRANDIAYGGSDQPDIYTLERLRYGAWLARQTRLPILTTGGALNSADLSPSSEGQIMANTLIQDYQIVPRWVEGESENTAENAQFSAAILKRAQISRIILVTHANHMPRAVAVFKAQGLRPTPAAMGYRSSRYAKAPHSYPWRRYLPSAKALQQSYLAGHEWLGQLWYRLQSTHRS